MLRKLGILAVTVAVLVRFAVIIIVSMWKILKILFITAIEEKTLWVKTNEKCKEAYVSSEATATKSSSSESTMVLELMFFLRGLRLAIGRN